VRADGYIPARTQRTVLSHFSGALARGEERVRISASLLDHVYGENLGPLLDLIGGGWRCEGSIADDVVFVCLEPPRVIRERWAAREAMLADPVRQSVEAPQESGIARE